MTYKTIAELVEQHAAKTEGGLTAAQKRILKEAIEKEDLFWARHDNRVDNNNSHDDA